MSTRHCTYCAKWVSHPEFRSALTTHRAFFCAMLPPRAREGAKSATSHRLRSRAELGLGHKKAQGRSLFSRWALLPD